MGKAIGITVVIMFLFYRSVWAIAFFPVVLFFQKREERRAQEERRQRKLQEEFLHGINVLNSALQAGLSMENAWREVEIESKLMYGTSSEWYLSVKEMNQKVAHNTPVEKLFLDLAYKTKLEDMIQFAELLEYGKRSGSDWRKIIENTVNQMKERETARQEIEVMVAEKKMEQQIMNILPLGLLAFLQISAEDYMSVLYHNWLGVIVMTIFLVVYIIAILISRKILKVQL